MINYRLKIDGDNIEKEAWDLFIQNIFPNYELFWLKFVVPRTNRPKNIRTKENLPKDEKILIMLHYAILINLYYVFKDFNNSYDRKTFENMYIRLSSATDVCEEFLFRFLIWINNKELSDIIDTIFNLNKKLTPNKNDAVKSLEKGKNYSLSIISKRDVIKKLTNDRFGIELFGFIDLIRHYRNFLVHSWPMFQIGNLYPKKETVKEYRDWVKVLEDLENDSKRANLIKTKYKDMKRLITEDFFNLLKLINKTWDENLKKIDEKSNKKG